MAGERETRVRAYSGTVLSNATQILIAAGPPQYIVVAAPELNVPYWQRVGDTVGVVAVVSDIYMNPVNDSTVVYFTTDEATIMSHHARTKGGKGIATSTWISGNNVPTAAHSPMGNAHPSERPRYRIAKPLVRLPMPQSIPNT